MGVPAMCRSSCFSTQWTHRLFSAADLASECDIVFAMLAADAAVESVFHSYLSGHAKKGSIFIDCSTIYPDVTAKLADQAEEAGLSYLACPVFGRPDAALAGKTLVVASGNPAAKAKVSALQSYRPEDACYLFQNKSGDRYYPD